MLRYKTLLLLLLFQTAACLGQNPGLWIRFWDTTTNRVGYKDLEGTVKIPAKLNVLTSADSFYHIIAVTGEAEDIVASYYLLKDGRKVAKDSVFMIDFMVDCESEGKILFHDRKTDRVGYLDTNGVAVIPALYNYATPFRNGLALAHRGAWRKCWDEKGDTTHCEHLGWDGGETLLINAQNEVLAERVHPYSLYNVNWYSLRINDPSADTSIYRQIRGRNGTVYAFVDYNKEFQRWFYRQFLAEACAGTEQLTSLCFPEITYWSEQDGWTSLAANKFFKTFQVSFAPERFRETETRKVSIGSEDLYADGELFRRYYNACGEHNRDQYPAFSVRLQHYKKRTTPYVKPKVDPSFPTIADATEEEWEPSEFEKNYETDGSEEFQFIRTEKGYQLYQVSLRK